MKKILLGTTAMMTAGLIAAGAQAGEGINLSVSGYYTGVATAVDVDADANTFIGGLQAAGGDVDDVQIKHEGEISFTGSTTLDNGLTVGAEANLEMGTGSGAGFDETFLFVEGSFGRVELGEVASAAHQMHISAPYFVGSHGVDSPNFMHATGASTRTASYITASGDSVKVSYFTPRVMGVQLGISYTPEVLFGDVGGQATANGGASFGLNVNGFGGMEDTIEIGGNWSGDFEGVAVGVSAGYFTADNNAAGASDPDAWSVGLSLASAGLTLSGGYYSSEDLANGLTQGDEEDSWSVGLQYETGPWTVGVAYFDAEQENAAGATIAEFDVVEVGGTYALGAGVDVFGVVELYDDDFNGAGAGGRTETDSLSVGIDLAF